MGRVRVFDDRFSLIHFLYACVVALLDPLVAIAATIVFIEYQRWERERRARKLGDFIEWLAGLLVGVLLRVLTGHRP